LSRDNITEIISEELIDEKNITESDFIEDTDFIPESSDEIDDKIEVDEYYEAGRPIREKIKAKLYSG